MRVTIIKSDNMVYKDGVAFKVDCSSMSSEIRAIQWYDDHGLVEYTDYRRETVLENLDDFSDLLAAWDDANAAYQAWLLEQEQEGP